MFCEECGHDLDANGVCPICGYCATKNAPSAQGDNVHLTQPPNMPQQQPLQNGMPGVRQPNMPQPQPNGMPGVNMQQPLQNGMPGVNMQQPLQSGMPGIRQPNMPQPQPNGMPGINMQQQQFNSMPTYNAAQNPYDNMMLSVPAPRKKRIWPIILGSSIAVLAIILVIIFILRYEDDDDTSTKTTETTERKTTQERTTATTTEEPLPPADADSRTIMVYMVGSNLESDHGCATSDIDEMKAAANDPNTQIVIYTGGAYTWHTPEISNTENCYLLVDDNTLTCLEKERAKNMGDPSTLSDFLNYCVDNYPAEQYSLVLWNHGGGVFFGYGQDERTNDSLTLDELSDALSASPFHGNNKLEWIGFDACLMATIETADVLSPFAKYMISSQEPEPSWGWDYSFIKELSSTDNGADIGKKIADRYIDTTSNNFNSTPFSYCDITMSVLDLSKVDGVEEALNDLFDQVTLDDSSYSKYSRIRTKTKEIASDYRGEQSYDAIDLVSYAKNLETLHLNEAINLENALNDLIVYSKANVANANGVSIYHPYHAKEYSQYYIPMYYQLGFAEEYAKYVASFANKLTGDVVSTDWDVAGLVPYMTGYSLNFALQLNEEQADAYQKAYYVISRADVENVGSYIFVAMNSQVDMDSSNTLTADFNGDVIYVQNNTTGDIYEAMYTEQETTDEYTRYLLTAILYNNSVEEEDAMYAYFVLETTPSNPQGTIIGCYPLMNYINTEGSEIFPDRYEIDINAYQNIAFGSISHEFTSNEDLTNFNQNDWSDATIWYNSMPISDGFSTITGPLYDGLPYYGMFVIEDSQGNRHCSSLVQLQ